MKAFRVALAAMVSLTFGCGPRATITSTQGKAYRAAFSRQDAPATRQPASPPAGLDSQEAAIIAESYRGSLSPKGARPDSASSPVILLSPQGQQPGAGAALAPSVPR